MIIERKLSSSDNDEAWNLHGSIATLQASVHEYAGQALRFLDYGKFIEAKGRLLIAAEFCGAMQSETSNARHRILAMNEDPEGIFSHFVL